jgi:hypothetical protein
MRSPHLSVSLGLCLVYLSAHLICSHSSWFAALDILRFSSSWAHSKDSQFHITGQSLGSLWASRHLGKLLSNSWGGNLKTRSLTYCCTNPLGVMERSCCKKFSRKVTDWFWLKSKSLISVGYHIGFLWFLSQNYMDLVVSYSIFFMHIRICEKWNFASQYFT